MAHRWRFFRAGGFDQVHIETGADLVAIGELDQKLWVALACPVDGLEFDRRTLQLINGNGDGRVRATELIEAVRWAAARLTDVESLAKGSSSLPLATIERKTDAGKLLARTAEALLQSIGKAGAAAIDATDLDQALRAFAHTLDNGDGAVPPDVIPDPDRRRAAEDVLACTAVPAADRSGKAGIDGPSIEAFFGAADAYLAWLDSGKAPGVRPLGEDTATAHAALQAVAAKVDDWFVRVGLAAFDERAKDVVNADLDAWKGATGAALVDVDRVRSFPVAAVAPGASLPLNSGVNPAWAGAIGALRDQVVKPLLGVQSALTELQWREIRSKFAPYEGWLAAKAGAAVEKLGESAIRELVASGVRAKLEEIVASDLAAKPLAEAIESVERLVRYHRDLIRLANNFVSFRDFYSRRQPAVFQAGTLYLDQRACNLCIRVGDAGRHGTMAPLSRAYLVYCDVKHGDGRTMKIAAAMTNGDVDNLMVGRNGVFYDRTGSDWDATVTSIVENPISIRQAFWSPYKKFLKLIEEQIAARVGAANAAADARVTAAAGHVDAAVAGAPPPAPKTFDVGTIAALGVAVGGISAAFGAVMGALFGLGWKMPFGLLGIILLISGPSMAIAWLKLRQRNLGPLLDANGWAVNAQAKLNVPLGESLTEVGVLPPGSQRDLVDPFAERSRPWGLYAFGIAIVALAVGWYLGKLDAYLPPAADSTTVLGAMAPAAAEAAAPAPAAAPAQP